MLVPMAGTRANDFERGIELFNAGKFFEAHEAWERVWLRASGEEKLFYQGLIQAAAALLHAERGNALGAQSMYAKARTKLDPLPDEYMGIALEDLRIALAQFFATTKNESELPSLVVRRIGIP